MSRPSDFATSSSSDMPSTTGRETIRRVLPYLWPKGEGWVKRRVVAALGMLTLAKIVSVSTPFFYKAAVDK
ncbi:MAG: metal ABC transporter permease, partial [Gemmobacter sp.]